jgi:hypothetical protein
MFRITTADVSTPENTDKVIMLATNMDDFEYGDFEYKAIFTRILGYGYSEGFFSRRGKEGPVERGGGGTKVGFNLNTISGIISGC